MYRVCALEARTVAMLL